MEKIYAPLGFDGIFAVPSAVVDRHIKLCSGPALKVLLLLLRSPEAPPTIADMAARLGLGAGDIADALRYWVDAGLIAEGTAEALQPPAGGAAAPAPPPEPAPKVIGRPRLPRPEMLSLIEQSGALRGLVDEIQMLLGRPLTSADMDALVALHRYYGLSAHFIMTVAQYCDAIGRLNMRSIEKTAAEWQDRGVTSENIDAHVAHMRDTHDKTHAVRRLLGLADRALSVSEQRYLNDWCDKMGMKPDVISVAYDLTVLQTGKPALPYMHKILSEWHKKGINDPESAAREHVESAPKAPERGGKGRRAAPERTPHADAGKLEQLEQLIEQKLRKEGGERP